MRTSEADGRAFALTGPASLTYHDAARILSEFAGREIRYVPVDAATFIRTLTAGGVPEALARYLAALFELVRRGAADVVTDDVRLLTGQRPLSLEEYAHDHADAWR